MRSHRSHHPTTHVTVSLTVIVLIVATAPAAWGQATPDLFTKVETLTLSDGTLATGNTSISRDIAVVGGAGIVHVFERDANGDHWLHASTLTPSDGTSGFGQSVDVDRHTIVIGADGGAFVFQRKRRGWQEVTKLTGDANSGSFGASVSISGTTVVVGAPAPDSVVEPGVAYVFERDQNGRNSWGEATRLMGGPVGALERRIRRQRFHRRR